jgi:lysophospholipase L1-like esterase
LGASDAVGVGVENPERDSWVAVLARRLPQPTRAVNLGLPGIQLRQALEVELPPALDAQPHLVTVWLVVNDVLAGIPLDHYRSDLNLLLGRLRSGTKAYVAVGNIPNPPESIPYLGLPPVQRRALADAWNAAIAAAVREHGAILVDLFNRWPVAANPTFIGPDGLHPTVAGYRSLAETFHAVLREARVV